MPLKMEYFDFRPLAELNKICEYTIKSPTSCRAFSYRWFRYNSCRTSRPGVALIIIVLCGGFKQQVQQYKIQP